MTQVTPGVSGRGSSGNAGPATGQERDADAGPDGARQRSADDRPADDHRQGAAARRANGRGNGTVARPATGRRAAGKVSPGDTRRHHLALVLQRLFDAGPRSRADLARETGLTRVTISDLIAELIDDGVITELGPRPGVRQGKPATLVGLADTAPVVIAIDLSGDGRCRGALVDLNGTTLHSLDAALTEGEEAIGQVVDLITSLREASTRPVLGVGVGTPGIVDHDGTVLHAPNLGWSALDLPGRLTQATGLAAHVANDADLAVTAESTFGHGHEDGLLLVTVGHGVGGGLLVDGRVLSGPARSAGEIGHIVVDPDGAPCACGNRGCLETRLAIPALRQATDPEQRAAVGTLLGSVLTPVVTTLGLTDVVLYGPDDLLAGPLLQAAQAAVTHQSLPYVAQRVQLRVVPLDQHLVLKGAAAHVRYRELGVV